MRAEKTAMVEDLSHQLQASPYVFLTDYAGLTVGNFNDLRKRLAGAAAECHVVKNSLMQRALAAANLPQANGALAGMTAMVIGSTKSEIAAVAERLPGESWIVGGDWGAYEAWEEGSSGEAASESKVAEPFVPNRGMIDEASGPHPVLIRRFDRSMYLANEIGRAHV